MSGTGAKKNTSDHINSYLASSKEVKHIYEALVGDVGANNNRNIFLKCGMLEWLCVFSMGAASPAVSGEVFRIKPIEDTSQDELVILFANMIGGRNHGALRS